MHALNTVVLNHTGMQVGSLHLTESAEKLPQELVIPNDQIRLLESIGQGELCCVCLQPLLCLMSELALVLLQLSSVIVVLPRGAQQSTYPMRYFDLI